MAINTNKPLKREDVMRLLQQAGSPDKLDLSEVNLARINLGELNLSGANLSGANLEGATLWETNLSRANLSKANLWAATTWRVDLSGANLEGANLEAANLNGANLEAANLSEASLYLANLSGANLSGAKVTQTQLLKSLESGRYHIGTSPNIVVPAHKRLTEEKVAVKGKEHGFPSTANAIFSNVVGFGCLLSLLAVVGIIIFAIVSHIIPQPSPLSLYVNQFLKISPGQSDASNPYIRGKIVIVDKNQTKIADLNANGALDAIRANKSEEVGTIIWLDYKDVTVGYYDDGSAAIQHTCDVMIIDKAANLIVGEKKFFGSDPPSVKIQGTIGDGSPVSDDDIVNYILGLPSR